MTQRGPRIKLERLARELMLVEGIRRRTAWARYQWFVRIKRRPLLFAPTSAATGTNAAEHNARAITADFGSGRSTWLIRPLSVIEAARPRLSDLDVLSVGPRSEGEILNLVGHGFQLSRIRGLDLFSYSPWIDCGDMHALPYPDDSFDVVLHSHALSYSEDKVRAIAEVCRVARPGALVAIGSSYTVESDDDLAARLGYLPGSRRRVDSVDAILTLFPEDAVGEIHWAQENRDHSPQSNIGVILSLR